MLLPSKKLWDKMQSSPAGLWLERVDGADVVLVCKLPTNIIKAMNSGAQTSLIVSVVEVGQAKIRCVGLLIHDDPDKPITTFRTHRDADEHLLLEMVLVRPCLPIHFFDELLRPLLSSSCSFAQFEAEQALKDLAATAPHYIGSTPQFSELALDIFESDLNGKSTGDPTKSLVWHQIRTSIAAHKPTQIHAVTAHEANLTLNVDVNQFKVDDLDEGAALEQSAHQLLEYIYPLNLYRSPQVQEGSSRRELTDLFAFSPEGLCLLELKVLSVTPTNLDRSNNRRAHGIQKQIKKALRQLVGAVRMVRSGNEVTTNRGHTIQIPDHKEGFIQAIVVISSMDESLTWSEIGKSIVVASKVNRTLFHVLDLMELQRLVSYSQRSDVFNINLCNRWEKVLETGNAWVRGDPLNNLNATHPKWKI